jgi:hypothetical protein
MFECPMDQWFDSDAGINSMEGIARETTHEERVLTRPL